MTACGARLRLAKASLLCLLAAVAVAGVMASSGSESRGHERVVLRECHRQRSRSRGHHGLGPLRTRYQAVTSFYASRLVSRERGEEA